MSFSRDPPRSLPLAERLEIIRRNNRCRCAESCKHEECAVAAYLAQFADDPNCGACRRLGYKCYRHKKESDPVVDDLLPPGRQ
jgi:hypothetical protein